VLHPVGTRGTSERSDFTSSEHGAFVFVGRRSKTPTLICMAGLFDWAVVDVWGNVGLFEYRPTGRSTALRSEAKRIHLTPSERGALRSGAISPCRNAGHLFS
jgi:hypothetical protein